MRKFAARTVRIPESLIQNVLISHKNLNSGHEKKVQNCSLYQGKEKSLKS